MSYCLADALLWKYEYFAVLLLLFDVYLHWQEMVSWLQVQFIPENYKDIL